ncbi:aromatic peroxygenase [Acrasis kona]|uniref:Aromatic peroxygenase n=1 Tax=Acrasis kona TaxID=1008807 RepID=A0AAW2YS27_9EUKA
MNMKFVLQNIIYVILETTGIFIYLLSSLSVRIYALFDSASHQQSKSDPKEGQQRSPCPFLNALCNDKHLPVSGSGVSMTCLLRACKKTTGINYLANILLLSSINFSFHGRINLSAKNVTFNIGDLGGASGHLSTEYDASLTRADYHDGCNSAFNHSLFNSLVKQANNGRLHFKDIAKVVRNRLLRSKTNNKHHVFGYFQKYNMWLMITLLLICFGDGKSITLNSLEQLFIDEKLPQSTTHDRNLSLYDIESTRMNIMYDSGELNIEPGKLLQDITSPWTLYFSKNVKK